MANNVVCKICKVYPAKNKRITGILPEQKMITEPGIYHLNLKEIRRCMSYADVFEVVTGGDVLLTPENYTADNSKVKVYPAAKVPELKDKTIHYGVHKPAEDTDKKEENASPSTKPSGSDSSDASSTPSEDKSNAVDSEQSQASTQSAVNTKSVKNSNTKSNAASK